MSKTNPSIEKLKAEVAAEGAKSKLDEAFEIFKDLLEEPFANAAQIGKLSEINSVAVGQLKSRTMSKISDVMFGKLKTLYDAVKAGTVVFEETHRGRKPGTVVNASTAPKEPKTPTTPKAPKVAKSPGRPKAQKQNVAIEAIMSEHKIVTAELIEQKKAELAKLTTEVQYLQDLKALQDKYKK